MPNMPTPPIQVYVCDIHRVTHRPASVCQPFGVSRFIIIILFLFLLIFKMLQIMFSSNSGSTALVAWSWQVGRSGQERLCLRNKPWFVHQNYRDAVKAIETKSTTSRQYVFLLRFTSKVTHVQLSTGFIYCPAKRVSLLPSVSLLSTLRFAPQRLQAPSVLILCSSFPAFSSILTFTLSKKIIFSHILQNPKLSSG